MKLKQNSFKTVLKLFYFSQNKTQKQRKYFSCFSQSQPVYHVYAKLLSVML